MKKVTIYTASLLLLPNLALAAGLQSAITNFGIFLNDKVIPFLIGIAFLFFAFNVIRYFVAGGSNEIGREKAKSLAIYGVLAFVIFIIFWGVINLLTSSLGFDTYNPNDTVSDYTIRRG